MSHVTTELSGKTFQECHTKDSLGVQVELAQLFQQVTKLVDSLLSIGNQLRMLEHSLQEQESPESEMT